MTGGREHLRDDVFHNHANVDLQLVEQELLIDFLRYQPFFIKSVADEKSGIAHVAFHGHAIHVELEADARFGGVEAEVGDHGIAKPENGVFIAAFAGILAQRG